MKEIAKMRLGVLSGLKKAKHLLDAMIRKTKSRDALTMEYGFMFLKIFLSMLNEGALSHENILLNIELSKLLDDKCTSEEEVDTTI